MANDTSCFRILDLPDELRLKIYAFILPRNERIFLDPKNFYHPLPYRRESYGETFSLLQVSRKIHFEATQFIYSNNTVNIIEPKEAGDFLRKLGPVACEFVSRLECHMTQDLGDLGRIWKTMESCSKLTDLRLVFYHDRSKWKYIAAQLIYYVIKKGGLKFELELYDSIWAAYGGYGAASYFSLQDAESHAKVYSFTLPSPLRKITITASVNPEITRNLKRSNGGKNWRHYHTGRQQNGEINHLEWIGSEIGRDIDLEEASFGDDDDDDDEDDDDDN